MNCPCSAQTTEDDEDCVFVPSNPDHPEWGI
jgi:hypothetical protein